MCIFCASTLLSLSLLPCLHLHFIVNADFFCLRQWELVGKDGCVSLLAQWVKVKNPSGTQLQINGGHTHGLCDLVCCSGIKVKWIGLGFFVTDFSFEKRTLF